MKTLFYTLAIIVALFFTGINSLNAQQASIYVHWDENCPDTCTSHDTCSYVVEYKVTNNCLHPPQVVCTGQQWLSCSSYGYTFHCNYDCEDATSNPCMFVEGFATKYCTGPGGTIVKCTGYKSVYKTCLQFMYGITDVKIVW
jgi:hypothetical protein